jgi:hypothetical protein
MTSEKVSLIAAQEFTNNVQTIFCKDTPERKGCHKPVCTIIRNGDKIQVFQGKNPKPLITIGANSSFKSNMKCPYGHVNVVQIGGNQGGK